MVRIEKIIDVTTESPYPILLKSGVYEVYDTHQYEITVISDTPIDNIDVELEDTLLDGKIISIIREHNNPYKVRIKTNNKKSPLFVDSFGDVTLSICNEGFNFDVRSKKLSIQEIEQMILYLYDVDDGSLSRYFSKNKSNINKEIDSDTSIPFSAKYLKRVELIIKQYEDRLPEFIKMPYTVIRKSVAMRNYDGAANEYDINWLLSNLDEVDIDDRYIEVDNAIVLEGEYGWLEKIKAVENRIYFDNYENNVIIDGLRKIRFEVKSALNTIASRLHRRPQEADKNYYESFRNCKDVYLRKLKLELEHIESRIVRILQQYGQLFNDINVSKNTARLTPPKLTPVFRSFNHYNSIFKEIMWLYAHNYNMDGELDLLGLNNVSELYEIYCLYQLKSCFRDTFGDQFNFNSSTLICDNNSLSVKLHYQPIISYDRTKSSIGMVSVGFYNTANVYRPDFVLELNTGTDTRYIIIDAKYCRYATAKDIRLEECTKKYLLDIGVVGNLYKKADFLFILSPERVRNGGNFNKDIVHSEFCPQRGIMCLKPNDNLDFMQFITELVQSV